MSLLCLLGIMHARHVGLCRQVHYSHISSHGVRRSGSRSDRSAIEVASPGEATVDHAVLPSDSLVRTALKTAAVSPIVPQVAAVAVKLALPVPEESHELLARENVLALGSAPRAPGLGRAPPTA